MLAPNAFGATLGNRPTNSSTLKGLHPIRRYSDTTPSELFSFCTFTQRSPTASVNAGLNDTTPLELPDAVLAHDQPTLAGRAQPFHPSPIFPAQCFVPQGQPEISRPQGGWSSVRGFIAS